MRRREFIGILVGASVARLLTASPPSAAQAAKVPYIGILSPAGPETTWFAEGLRQGLSEHGYVDGQNIKLEFRWAYGRFDRLPGLAAELVALNVDVIIAGVTQASLAAKAATRTVPIVMVAVGDPLGTGLVESLARPGGNITGTSNMTTDVVGKQMELLKELDPGLSSVAVLWNPANAVFQARQVEEAKAASRRLGLLIDFFAANAPEAFDAAFAAIRRDKARALHVLGDPVFTRHLDALLAQIAKERLPAVSGFREFAERGGLLAYGPNYYDAARRSAAYVHKILGGTKPGELPVEQPTTFELLVNLKSAEALGVTIPASILTRADEVID
jgi:putative ABC transport system substrate-binding protein